MRVKLNRKKQYFTPSLAPIVRLVFCFFILFHAVASFSQNGGRKKINIEQAKVYLYNAKVNKDVQRLLGDVELSHENVIMYCDSAWAYNSSNSVDAFGRVHIISHDTLHLHADFVNYNGQTGLAQARGNVVLKDKKVQLTTDTLDYDMNNEIGFYNCGGTIVDSTNTLTSIIGRYYSKEDLLFFKDSVKLVNKDYTMWSDTMKYNTQTETVYIVGPTHIEGDSSTLYSELGWFNTQTKLSELLKNSVIKRGNSQLEGDSIYFDDNTASGKAVSNVVLNDFGNKIIITGNYATYDDFNKNAIVTDSAVFIQYDEKDSLFLHADTMHIIPDTSAIDQRIVMSYYDVRFYRYDLQGICDSLVYYSKDSTIRLFDDPVLWSDQNQMSAEDIEMINNVTPPNEVYMNNNSFIIQQVDSSKYNQIKGKNMIGYITDRQLYLVDVKGNGQSIFYPADDKGVIGVNKAESSNIKIYLFKNKIKRITFVTSPVGVMNPLMETVSADTKLEGFNWRFNERPLDKKDIFREKGATAPLKTTDVSVPPVRKELALPER